jgi:zinc/manganese transport system permease protein
LIIPALATHRLIGRRRLVAAYGIGGLSYLLGIVLSSVLDLPTGAVIVWTMAAVAMAGNLLLKPHSA